MTHKLLQFRLFSLFFKQTTIIFFSIKTVLSAYPHFEACEPRNCGNVTNISYPFWISDQESFCGLPEFELTCRNDEPVGPVLRISDTHYIVQYISYDTQTLSVFNSEFESFENDCPRVRNLTFNNTRFTPSRTNYNYSFFFNCTEPFPQNLSSALKISCLSNDSHYSFATFGYWALSIIYMNITQTCLSSAVVPVVEDSYVTANPNSGNYLEFLRMGFLLQYLIPVATANDCFSCEGSGGRCGSINDTIPSFVCFCSDRPHPLTCNDSRGPDVPRKVIVGLSAGFGSFFIACFLCFLYYRRRSKRLISSQSTLLSSNYPSDSSLRKDLEKSSSHFFTHIFSYKELEEATNNFHSSKELGDGGFGTVYHGKLRDGRSVAVKRLYENNYKRVEQFMNEVAILSGLRHQNLVSLYGCTSRHSRELLLVYEYVPNGTVADHLHGDRAKPEAPLTWPFRLSIAIETAEALSYLHAIEPQIIHRDVKTNNILLDSNFHVKVADFGLSRLFPMDVTHVSTAPQGTPGYVDPDYHQCYQLTDKSDVYSFGVVLMELISSKPAVDITRHRHEINLATMAINKIQNQALDELVDPKIGCESDSGVRRMVTLVAELGFRCLQLEKDMRPSMEEVVEILKGIESEGYRKVENLTAGHSPSVADDVVLLKVVAPFSPDSVMEKWSTRSTTPNTKLERRH